LSLIPLVSQLYNYKNVFFSKCRIKYDWKRTCRDLKMQNLKIPPETLPVKDIAAIEITWFFIMKMSFLNWLPFLVSIYMAFHQYWSWSISISSKFGQSRELYWNPARDKVSRFDSFFHLWMCALIRGFYSRLIFRYTHYKKLSSWKLHINTRQIQN